MDSEKRKMTEFFNLYPWPSDPESEKGRVYFESSLKSLEKLVDHVWIKNFEKEKRIDILEICGGAGFGGIALAKLLEEKGINVNLLITDIRDDVLLKAERFGEKILNKKIETYSISALEVNKLKREFDLVLMFGCSSPNFSPFDMIRLLKVITKVLKKDGIFIIDEADRIYSIFLTAGYQKVLLESSEEAVISFHTGYDISKGMIRRTFINFTKNAKPITVDLYFWNIAELSALISLFFENFELIKLEGTRHFIMGKNPNKNFKKED